MTFKHLENVSARAEFSPCGFYRYLLNLEFPEPQTGKTLCVVMQNPSLADAVVADKSVQFLERLVFQKRIPEFREVNTIEIVNQFAFIQQKEFEGSPAAIGDRNDETMRRAFGRADIVLLAWGRNNPYSERQDSITEMLSNFPALEVYKSWKHPSRGRYENFVIPYRSAFSSTD